MHLLMNPPTVSLVPRGREASHLSFILARGLRIAAVRRLLAWRRWLRPEHIDRMSPDEFRGYIAAIGMEAESQAILAKNRGVRHQREADSGVRGSAESADRRAGTILS